MAKLLFTADIHIKLGQKNVPVEWARSRFNMFLEQLGEMETHVDRTVIGGDVFDRLPNMDEVELYFDLVASRKKPTLIYPGNHEMLKKDTTFLSYLKRATNRLNSLVTVIDDFYSDHEVDIIPYNKLKQYYPQDIDFHNRILLSHCRGEILPHVKPEVPLELFDRWDVVLAGDLHSYENSQRNILYPGSPYTTSFHRQPVSTGAIILDTVTLSHTWEPFKLPQLLKATIQAGSATTPTEFDHTIYEIEGDINELGQLEDSELIAKKVVKRAQDTQLILDPDLTLAEEIQEYLAYILMLPDETIGEVLKEFYNYADRIES